MPSGDELIGLPDVTQEPLPEGWVEGVDYHFVGVPEGQSYTGKERRPGGYPS